MFDSFLDYLQNTMLLERLAGVSVYVLVLGYFYNKIQHARTSKNIDKYLNQYLLILCLMAFLYIPGTNSDLFRWRSLAQPWMNETFSWFWAQRVLPSQTPLGYLFIYACQKTGIDGLLPMLCSLGFFGNVFHIIKCESKRLNRTPDSIAVALLFVMSSGRFLEVISGIRCMLAFSIVFRFFYDETYENKSILRSIPFYVISVFLHTASIPLIGIRLMCSLFEKKKSAIKTILNFLIAIVVFVSGIRIGEDYIDAGFRKANSYISYQSYSYIWEYIIVLLSMTVVVYVLIKLKKRYPKQFYDEISSIRYLLFLLIIQLATITTYSIFHRLCAVSIVLSIPALLTFLYSENINYRKRSRQFIVLMSLLILFISCMRGNLCSYKFLLIF